MNFNPKFRVKKILILGLMLIWGSRPVFAAFNLDRLSDADIKNVKNLIKKLEPFILNRSKNKDLAKLTFDELYTLLNAQERIFLKSFENLDAKVLGVKTPYWGLASGKEDLVLIVGQKVKVRDHQKEKTKKFRRELPAQFLPRDVYAQYQLMISAMKKDIGKKLFVESGYRSSAYQLYLFVYYLQNHKYSIRETVKFVALPGYSEHGAPKHQAIDFINEDGINGQQNPSEFDVLPEFIWLQRNAAKFGFVLSYPKNSSAAMAYEPWHWRYSSSQVFGWTN